MYIEKINGPEDVKKLNIEEMTALAEEMRHALLKRASIHGGHFGPNFGMVEAIIALHYVFESPKDKMVFDVSHQTYPHKMLTGRKDAYLYEEHYDDVMDTAVRRKVNMTILRSDIPLHPSVWHAVWQRQGIFVGKVQM